MIISLRPCWGFVKGICHMSLFSKNMYPENRVHGRIWKTTLNIHQLKNNKYKQSHKCSNDQQMDLLVPWHIVSSILEVSWPLIEILIWYPSNIWIILMVSPVWLSFLCPWTLFYWSTIIDILRLQSLNFLDPWLRFWFDVYPVVEQYWWLVLYRCPFYVLELHSIWSTII